MQLGVYDLQRNYDTPPVWTNNRRWWQTRDASWPLSSYDLESFSGLGFVKFIPALAAELTSVVAAVAPLYLAREHRKVSIAQINADATRTAQAQSEAQAAYAPSRLRQSQRINYAAWALPAGIGLLVILGLKKRRRGRR